MWLAVRRQLGRKAGRCQESAAMLARSVSSSAATFGQNDDPFQRPQGTVDFGYQHVPREEKQTLVGQVFSSVAGSYDIMNDLMSGGMHRLWKDRLVEKLRPRPGHRHLDVAGGTGDVAFRVWDAMRASNRGYGGRSSSFPSPSSVGSAVEDATVAAEGLGAAAAEGVAKAAAGVAPPAAAERLADAAAGYKQERLQHQDQLEQQQFHRQEAQLLQQDLAEQQQVHLEEQRLRGALPAVTVCDINTAMLAEGRRKAEARGIGPESVQWVEGNAEALPFPSNSYDSYTIAFGIRNVTDRPAALREAHRVLRPGGRLLCLEFSKLVVPGMQQLYDLYSFNVIPQIGRVVANDAASYQYLVESIRLFPDQETWAGMIEQAGFKGVDYENLSLGVVAIHSAFKMG